MDKTNEVIPLEQQLKQNLGTRPVKNLPPAKFPDADLAVRAAPHQLDVLLVNPPTPDRAIWIRSQHRVGRKSRENMIWPQMDLAQLAALLAPDYTVAIIDANAERLSWPEFEAKLKDLRPRFYLTQVTAPTLTNDLYGAFLARSLGAITIAFGTHVTPMPRETLQQFPALDFVLRGEPELTLRELLDTIMVATGEWHISGGRLTRADGKITDEDGHLAFMMKDADPTWEPAWALTPRPPLLKSVSDFRRGGVARVASPLQTTAVSSSGEGPRVRLSSNVEEPLADERLRLTPAQLAGVRGLAWRNGAEIRINPDRPFIRNLDDLPIPLHHLLPFDKYRIPMIKGPYTFIVTSRGCPAGCKYCIKHVSYQFSIRVRTPENIMQELRVLKNLGIKHVNMYADLFTVNREQVMGLCQLMIEEKLGLTWTCNSRVDCVDEELLQLMSKSGCTYIAWGIESSNEQILKKAAKGYRLEQAPRALQWAHAAGIKNWGYFIIGLPGETAETIRATIKFAKALPLDIALFHIAAPYPGTPFFFEVLDNNWFRAGTQWEQVDMDNSTVLDYPGLKAEELAYWQKRAFREWAFRPGPIWMYLKGMADPRAWKSALEIGLATLGWVRS